jgi:class 3 adenylate cyclase
MKRVRAAIEDMLLAHGMRLIETRGDNYLAITTDDDGPAPAARALRFAARASAAVADLRGTRLRVGLASGHVTVAALRCMGGREVLCLFGDAVNVAGRLEQVLAAPARTCWQRTRTGKGTRLLGPRDQRAWFKAPLASSEAPGWRRKSAPASPGAHGHR